MKYCPNCAGPLLDVIDVSGLSERHQAALVIFVAKFTKGAQEHGDLQRNQRWTRDMLDEAIDKSFYEIFQLLEILDQEKD